MNKLSERVFNSKVEFRSERTLKNLLWYNRSLWGRFGVILLLLLIVTAIASLVTRAAFFSQSYKVEHKIALIAPLTGESAEIGISLQRGAEIYVKDINAAGGVGGKFVGLSVFDSQGETSFAAELASEIAKAEDIIGIISPWSSASVDAVAEAVKGQDIVVVSPSPQSYDISGKHKNLFNISYSEVLETQFLANYLRNVLQQKLVSIVYDTSSHSTSADEFTKTFERFGIPLRHTWSVNPQSADVEAQAKRIAEEIKETADAGAIYLAMNEHSASKVIEALRDVNAINLIVGPHMLASTSFAKTFDQRDYARLVDGVIMATPLTYDTANQEIQAFRSSYLETYKNSPDWIAAYGFESASAIGDALNANGNDSEGADGGSVRANLNQRMKEQVSLQGVAGFPNFDEDGGANKPIKVGVYDGSQIISAPTQLQPIEQGEVDNYIQAVRDGRALYVNDRFMYKTNVVYSGLLIEKVSEYNPADETVQLDFVVWFRYRGDFEPQNVIFENAVSPVILEEPDRIETIGDLKYLRYRVKARFDTNYVDVFRNYGSKLIGTNFRHQVLNKNNLIYVVDVVGVGLTDGGTYQDQLKNAKAFGPVLGLIPQRSWMSQEVVRSNGLGNPNFVGYRKPAPDFSKLGVGIVAVDSAVTIQDFLPSQYLVYIAIFGLFGSLFAFFMDWQRDGKRFLWNFQSWLLRLVSWPLLLAAAGSLLLNFAFQNLEFYYVDLISPFYEASWWVIGALLVKMAIERFIWTPLEQKTERKVPGSIRMFVTAAVFLFALFGIIAFVLHQELTSLLATSGLMAMIIGLAIQANIANIFSGIVLNLERPFNVDDVITIENDIEARVTDISWRTTRAVDGMGRLHCIPNSKATEASLVRITGGEGEAYEINLKVYIDVNVRPEKVLTALRKGVRSVEGIVQSGTLAPRAHYLEMVHSEGVTAARYMVHYTAKSHTERWVSRDWVWEAIMKELDEAGIRVAQRQIAKYEQEPVHQLTSDQTKILPAE